MADNDPAPLSASSSRHSHVEDGSPARSFSPPSPSQLNFGGAATTATSSAVPPLPATQSNPGSSAPTPGAEDTRNKDPTYDILVTPLRDTCSPFAYDPATDKQRGPYLIGHSAMGPRFRQLPVDEFLKRVPGDAPTAEDRKKFEGVDCSGAKLEKHLYPLLNAVANSVLDACDPASLTWLSTSTHRATDPADPDGKKHTERTGTCNDAGVYLNTTEARKATMLTEKQLKNSKISAEERQAGGKVGARNWHWMAIPVEVKLDQKKSAFVFNEPPKRKKKTKNSSAAKSSQPPPPATAGGDTSAPSGKPEGQADHLENTEDDQAPVADAEGADKPDAQSKKPAAKQFIRGSTDGEAALGQFTEYMLNVLNAQHRVFCYGIYVWQHRARLCIFDRGGAAVSEDFVWTTTDSPLHDFLWKVGHMEVDSDKLGYDPTATRVKETVADPTATPVEDPDAKAFKDMAEDLTVHETIRNYVKAATAKGVPIYKLRIIPMPAPDDEGLPIDPSAQPDESSGASGTAPHTPDTSPAPPVGPMEREFLVGKPHFVTDSLVGRCTRGYVAYDLHTKRLCFLKDYWRPCVPGRTRPEHLVYERLNSCGVQNIATLICGGDVGGLRAQQTLIQGLLTHMEKPPVPRVHYRLATEEIGLPLEDFKNFKELAMIFYDAIIAHHDAWTLAKVLHRDISIGNILIDPVTRKGILIDWDLCRFIWELALGPTEPDRTGTWEFRSALSLSFPRKPPRLSDDLESFIHAFRYLVLKYHITNKRSLKNFITSTFEGASVICGVKVGGDAKLAQMRSPDSPFEVYENPALQAVIDGFHAGCHESYRQLDIKKIEKRYGIIDPQLLKASRPVPTTGNQLVQQPIAIPTRSLRPPTAAPTVAAPTVAAPTAARTATSTATSTAAPTTAPTAASTAPSTTTLAAASTTTLAAASTVASSARTSRKDAAPGQAKGTERDDSASDPSAIVGFLSQHHHLSGVLDEYQKVPPIEDKCSNQFVLRSQILGQDILAVPPRPTARGIGSLSISSATSYDLIPSSLHPSLSSSSSYIPVWSYLAPAPGKHPREDDEKETSSVADNSDHASSSICTPDVDADLPEGIRQQGRRKRQRVDTQ